MYDHIKIMMIAIVNTTEFQVNEEYSPLQSFILNLDLTLKLNFFLFLSGINKNKIKHYKNSETKCIFLSLNF